MKKYTKVGTVVIILTYPAIAEALDAEALARQAYVDQQVNLSKMLRLDG